jgi:hypothetical protein
MSAIYVILTSVDIHMCFSRRQRAHAHHPCNCSLHFYAYGYVMILRVSSERQAISRHALPKRMLDLLDHIPYFTWRGCWRRLPYVGLRDERPFRDP